MGELYRSEPMVKCELFLQTEAAYTSISELGELGLIQLIDLSSQVNAFQKRFVNEVRRCEEMERKLRFLDKEIKKDDIEIEDRGDHVEAPPPREMSELEFAFEKLENEMKEVNANAESLKRNFLELTELKHVLRKTQIFFDEREGVDFAAMSGSDSNIVAAPDPRSGVISLRFVTGVIQRERLPAFERLLWRACRGTVYLKRADIDTPLSDPITGDEVYKTVFIIFFQGDQLKTRIEKICEGFRASLYPCPESIEERREMSLGVMTRIEDLNLVLSQTQDHRRHVLMTTAKNIRTWFVKVRKIKAIYHTLNMLRVDVSQKCLIGQCWCPVSELDRIQMALRTASDKSGSSIPAIINVIQTKEAPPTFNRTNKFTKVFQTIINSYGVASYREVNPAPFAIVTFPFLFSVMFGDAGHGLLLFLAGFWMVVMERKFLKEKSDNEIWRLFFGGRYIILLMGAFSIYAGLMYNDVFSKSLNIFGSSWYPNASHYTPAVIHSHKDFTLNPLYDYNGNPYPFGMDPVWMIAHNKISWLNSFKMKISVIFGVSQMFFGVILSLQNHLFFEDPIGIYFEFIPQMIFLMCIFGYLIVLIFYKWIVYDASLSGCAPSLLIDLINMFLMNYPSEPCSSATFYTGQKSFQTFLVLLALLCVPWLLLGKPLMLRHRNKQKMASQYRRTSLIEESQTETPGTSQQALTSERLSVTVEMSGIKNAASQNAAAAGGHHHDDEKFDFGDIFVHQCIHTIEYCLGCISHTASYLRLWALSLAHAELSEVLWNMLFRMGLKFDGYTGLIGIFILFAPWATLTVCILLLMEGLSAFLHTLRLHWVEFQSKFYKGDGYLFQPFDFQKIIHVKDEE